MQRWRVTPFFNGESRFMPYREGDRMIRGAFPIDAPGQTPEEAAEYAFKALGADERWNRFSERSLSVGDVLKVQPIRLGGVIDRDEAVHYLGCEPLGFRRLSTFEEVR